MKNTRCHQVHVLLALKYCLCVDTHLQWKNEKTNARNVILSKPIWARPFYAPFRILLLSAMLILGNIVHITTTQFVSKHVFCDRVKMCSRMKFF